MSRPAVPLALGRPSLCALCDVPQTDMTWCESCRSLVCFRCTVVMIATGTWLLFFIISLKRRCLSVLYLATFLVRLTPRATVSCVFFFALLLIAGITTVSGLDISLSIFPRRFGVSCISQRSVSVWHQYERFSASQGSFTAVSGPDTMLKCRFWVSTGVRFFLLWRATAPRPFPRDHSTDDSTILRTSLSFASTASLPVHVADGTRWVRVISLLSFFMSVSVLTKPRFAEKLIISLSFEKFHAHTKQIVLVDDWCF